MKREFNKSYLLSLENGKKNKYLDFSHRLAPVLQLVMARVRSRTEPPKSNGQHFLIFFLLN